MRLIVLALACTPALVTACDDSNPPPVVAAPPDGGASSSASSSGTSGATSSSGTASTTSSGTSGATSGEPYDGGSSGTSGGSGQTCPKLAIAETSDSCNTSASTCGSLCGDFAYLCGDGTKPYQPLGRSGPLANCYGLKSGATVLTCCPNVECVRRAPTDGLCTSGGISYWCATGASVPVGCVLAPNATSGFYCCS